MPRCHLALLGETLQVLVINHCKLSVWGVLPGALFAGLALLGSQAANALAFEPTETEWVTWPQYCKARYMESAAGRKSLQFAGRIGQEEVHGWKASLGGGWVGLHHHCAGLVVFDRARAEPDKQTRLGLLRRVIEENRFALDRMPYSHPIRAKIAVHSGWTYVELGETERAERQFDEAIGGCPECPDGYYAKALYYKKQGKLEDARGVLETGDAAVNGSSAEIHYFLGLILLDIGDLEGAASHADRAYGMGYPLPGLRDRIAASKEAIDK